jgi:ATP-dependent RNA helicase RhlE
VVVAKIHGNRSQSQRTEALAGFKSGKVRILVATDIVARGIDVEALGHVVNFDVPNVPDDYIHRVGRTARAETTGDAFTFVSPDEEADLSAIERAVGKRLPRVTLPGFDYTRRATEALEIPLAERLAAHRAKRKVERAHTAEKDQRRAASGQPRSSAGPAQRPSPPSGPRRGPSGQPRDEPAAPPSPPGSTRLNRTHRGGRRGGR